MSADIQGTAAAVAVAETVQRNVAASPPVRQAQPEVEVQEEARQLTEATRQTVKQATETRSDLSAKAVQAVEQLNSVMDTFGKGIRFRTYKNTDEMYVQIVDRRTDKVLRTIPPESLLEQMDKLHEVLGMIFDGRG